MLLLFFFVIIISNSTGNNTEICSQPKVTGPCRGGFYRFAYNSRESRCESFIYGGCKGNDNNFLSLLECLNICGEPHSVTVKEEHCKLPPIFSQDFECSALIPKFTFNYDSLSCESFEYGGCGATANLYDTVKDCYSSCIFGNIGSSPLTQGCERPFGESYICNYFTPRWTFDYRQGICVEFRYGGCLTSKNNFASLSDCQSRCYKNKSFSNISWKRPAFCFEPPLRTSSCLGEQSIWTYSLEKESCIQILTGACQTSSNAFATQAECIGACDFRV